MAGYGRLKSAVGKTLSMNACTAFLAKETLILLPRGGVLTASPHKFKGTEVIEGIVGIVVLNYEVTRIIGKDSGPGGVYYSNLSTNLFILT